MITKIIDAVYSVMLLGVNVSTYIDELIQDCSNSSALSYSSDIKS